MSAKRAKKVVASNDEKQILIDELILTLKVDANSVVKIAQSEKRLLLLKAEKLSSKCKVERQRARNLKFFRHEHTADTISKVQRLSTFV